MVNIQALIDDAKCFETIHSIRWPDGVRCPGVTVLEELLEELLEHGRTSTRVVAGGMVRLYGEGVMWRSTSLTCGKSAAMSWRPHNLFGHGTPKHDRSARWRMKQPCHPEGDDA
jgi:hypothetical protein